MNRHHRSRDGRLVDYLRRRGDAPMSPSLADEVIEAASRTPQEAGRTWSPFATPVLAAAVVVLAVMLTVGGLAIVDRQVGDDDVTPFASPSASTVPPTLSPTPTQSSDAVTDALVEPGDSVELAAVDPMGEWGTISVERGQDLGGYSDAEIRADAFVIELFVDYTAERLPDPEQFGSSDWALRPTDPDAERFFVVEPTTFERYPTGTRPEAPLLTYPGAIDIFTTPTEGWIAFQVHRGAAELELELVYWPSGFDEPMATILVREPGEPPEPIEPDEPPPTPAPPDYVQRPELPITVIDSAEADDLFSRPDSCTNPVDGYGVTFPDDWYTNTEVGDTPACSWFTPEFFEVDASGQPSDEIWISLGVIDGSIGYTSLTQIYSNEEISIDGVTAQRVESNPDPNDDPSYRRYWYVIPVGTDDAGPTFVAQTDTDSADDYELARAVLDRIMASLEFDR